MPVFTAADVNTVLLPHSYLWTNKTNDLTALRRRHILEIIYNHDLLSKNIKDFVHNINIQPLLGVWWRVKLIRRKRVWIFQRSVHAIMFCFHVGGVCVIFNDGLEVNNILIPGSEAECQQLSYTGDRRFLMWLIFWESPWPYMFIV